MAANRFVTTGLVTILILLFCTQCRREDPYFTLIDTLVKIDDHGGECRIQLSTNMPYSPASSQDWITVVSFNGECVVLNVDRNESEEAREGKVILFVNENREQVVINQDPKPSLSFRDESVLVPNAGGEVSVNILGNVDYELFVDVDWIVPSPSKAMDSHSYAFSITANEEAEQRIGHIIVANKTLDLQAVFTVTQQLLELLIVEEDSYEVEHIQGELSVPVTTNLPLEVISDSPWIQQLQTKGIVTQELLFSIDANKDSLFREGTILLQNTEFGQVRKLTVKQKPKPTIRLSTDVTFLESSAGRFSFTVWANVSYYVSPQADWIQNVSSPLTEQGLHSFSYGKNDAVSERRAGILFIAEDESIQAEMMVVQNGREPVMVMKHVGSVANAPVLEGDSFGCRIDWGDGITELYSPGIYHIYTDGKDKHQITISLDRITGFKVLGFSDIESLNLSEVSFSH